MTITNNGAEHRFETEVDGRRAISVYRLSGDQILLTHTEVPDELEGQGIASELTRAALDHARAEGLKVVPQCPFVQGYLEEHPEYQDLVAS